MKSLITYGNYNFQKSKIRLLQQAKEYNLFDYLKAYGPEDLDSEFSERFKHILAQSRIGGYGIWRPYIIKKELDKLKDGDFLIYLDAGCTLIKSGKPRFLEYLQMLKESDKAIISFQMSHLLEKWYTTKQIFEYFNVQDNKEITDTGQYLDGILIMKKCDHVSTIIDIWLKAIYDHAEMFTDCYNGKQESYFRDNRHEQSVFSVIRKMEGSIVLEDETWFEPFGTDKSCQYPIWATRIKG